MIAIRLAIVVVVLGIRVTSTQFVLGATAAWVFNTWLATSKLHSTPI